MEEYLRPLFPLLSCLPETRYLTGADPRRVQGAEDAVRSGGASWVAGALGQGAPSEQTGGSLHLSAPQVRTGVHRCRE